MKKRIFRGTFFTTVTVFFICALIISAIFYSYYTYREKVTLETEFSYLIHMAEEHGIDHIETLHTADRIRMADKDGNLLINGKNCHYTENFKESEEFEKATTGSIGYVNRFDSITRNQPCVYEKLSNGSVICLYDTQYSYPSLLFSMLPYMIGVMLIAAVISLILSKRLSNSILKPVDALNLENPKKEAIYPEFHPFIDKINKQNEQLHLRLSELAKEHKEQDKMRREFTANVSHELKTPLTSISGYAEIIQNGLVKDGDVKVFAGRIHDESQRMITLVGDIIKLSQLDENEISVKNERINLTDCTNAIISSLEPLAKEKNITVTLEGDNAEITGPEIIVEEIIHNILSNAIKYNKENGSVEIKIRQCVDGVEYSVKDTGIGIPEKDLERVFERFYRVDKSHSKEIGGTGLGLSIVKHGAKFMGASVSIQSKEGVGTTIRILF